MIEGPSFLNLHIYCRKLSFEGVPPPHTHTFRDYIINCSEVNKISFQIGVIGTIYYPNPPSPPTDKDFEDLRIRMLRNQIESGGGGGGLD